MYSLKRACEKLLGGMSKRSLMIILALTVTIATAAGSTLAFLYGTQGVHNTFTYSASVDVNINLDETDTGLDGDLNPDTNQYPMIPGQPIPKDPKVTVYAGGLDCWVFVEIIKSTNFDDFLEYAMAAGWEALDNVPGVFYRKVDASGEDQLFPVLEGNVVNMKESVTLNQLAGLTDADYPTLTIKAYAIQRDANIADTADAQSAWALLANVR